MKELKKVLVPVDFSPICKKAAHFALMLSEPFNPNVDILHVWDLPPYLGPFPVVQPVSGPTVALPEYAKNKVEEAMAEFFAELEQDIEKAQDKNHFIEVNRRIETGPPAETIIEVANEGNYDLIVMGTHGRKGIAHLFIGSVAEKVVRGAHCPVVTVPPTDNNNDK